MAPMLIDVALTDDELLEDYDLDLQYDRRMDPVAIPGTSLCRNYGSALNPSQCSPNSTGTTSCRNTSQNGLAACVACC